MKHPNPDMLLRIAQGDAFGAGCEYLGDSPVAELQRRKMLEFTHYRKHPMRSLPPGMYTDDGQMSLAVAEAILEGKDKGFSEKLFADAFVHAFKRDPRKGYAKSFQGFLEEVKDGDDFLLRIKRDSDKNGAAMRSVPIGVFPKIDTVLHVARLQAALTHNTPDGLWSAEAVATMSHFALYSDEPFSELGRFCNRYVGGFLTGVGERFHPPVVGPGVGVKTVAAVYHLLKSCGSLLDIARKAVEWGGDTDTVLAIAWGIASARYHEELPAFFEGGLERGEYGSGYLQTLGTKLMAEFASEARSV